MFVVGAYMLITAVTPSIVIKRTKITAIKLDKKKDQVIIPQLGIQEGIYEGGPEVLENGTWHRYPERGKPGVGNFILSGHRFVMGNTPGETLRKSPFYNLGKIKVGDPLYVDWRGRRFSYKVTKTYQVKPNEVSIEAPSKKHKLTLYTCTLSGSADGRLVIEAELVPIPTTSAAGA
jgi:sortase A